MKLTDRSKAGVLFFFGAVQFVITLVAAEALYPGYSISGNWISDLGVGSTAPLFNSSVFLFGACILTGSFLLFRILDDRLFSALVGLAGLGAMGVGVFPETTGLPHFLSADLVFLAGALAAIAVYRVAKPPFSWLSAALGVLTLAAVVLLKSHAYLGIGFGGMERMVVYPVMLWAMGFGGYLLAPSKK